MSTSRGRSRSSCSGAREWGFIGGRKLQGFSPKHTKSCNPKRTNPQFLSRKIKWFRIVQAGPNDIGSVAQIGRLPNIPFPQIDLSYSVGDGCAEGGEAVQESDTHLELGN
jgi:hypothetical protein